MSRASIYTSRPSSLIDMSTIPQIVRIKRKRGQDPLQALILEGAQTAKRSKTSSPAPTNSSSVDSDAKSWYFELSSTDDRSLSKEGNEAGLVLSETSTLLKLRHFVLSQPQTEEETKIPQELHHMLDEFLTLNDHLPEKLKKRRGSLLKVSDGTPSEDPSHNDKADDFVFDVYKLSNNAPLTSMNYPQTQIGYIRFFEDDKSGLLNVDESKDLRINYLSDDEDSNAESYYQNDYPEDEDAGELSETYEDFNADSDDDYDSYDEIPIITQSAEQKEGQAYLRSQAIIMNNDFDNLYDEFFDEDGNRRANLLQESENYNAEAEFDSEASY